MTNNEMQNIALW